MKIKQKVDCFVWNYKWVLILWTFQCEQQLIRTITAKQQQEQNIFVDGIDQNWDDFYMSVWDEITDHYQYYEP